MTPDTNDTTNGTAHGDQHGKTRNSSLELLRIIAMLMIVSCHSIISNDFTWLAQQPLNFSKFVLQVLMMGGGWVGNVIFFTISAWYISERRNSVRSSFRKVWILERELLFWSIVLLAAFAVMQHFGIVRHAITAKLTIQSLFPLTTTMWWYPTSYALFVLFSPFLVAGLQSLGRKLHGVLSVLMLVLYGLGSLVPMIHFDITASSVFVMMYWFILISYYRWYMTPLPISQIAALIITGECIFILYWLGSNILTLHFSKGWSYQAFIFDHWKLPSLLVGFGIFLLFSRLTFTNAIINSIAASTFGVYLIHQHPLVDDALWERVFSFTDSPLMHGHVTLGIIGAVIIVFANATLLDYIRRIIFKFTVNRHRGRCFDRLWSMAYSLYSHRTDTNTLTSYFQRHTTDF